MPAFSQDKIVPLGSRPSALDCRFVYVPTPPHLTPFAVGERTFEELVMLPALGYLTRYCGTFCCSRYGRRNCRCNASRAIASWGTRFSCAVYGVARPQRCLHIAANLRLASGPTSFCAQTRDLFQDLVKACQWWLAAVKRSRVAR